MMRFITPIILIGIAITFFFLYTNPMYTSISGIKSQIASYDSALSTSKSLEADRDTLTAKYNAIDPSNFDRIQKFLPDNVNNIRLILEVEQIAAPYGMTLSSISYDSSSDNTGAGTTSSGIAAGAGAVVRGGSVAPEQATDYGTFDLSFSTSGTYDNFISFTKDLESNLRLVDISSVSFSSDTGTQAKAGAPEVYKYDFKIKTYWLKS